MDLWRDEKAIETWWASNGQRQVKRPYPASTVIPLRDIFPENTTSNWLSTKLRHVFAKHASAGTSCFTYGVPDGVGLQKMSEAGFGELSAYRDFVPADCRVCLCFRKLCGQSSDSRSWYGSGTSVKASRASPDRQADYTYDAVPTRVELLNRAQLLQARIADFQSPGSGPDVLLPLLADGDSGSVLLR